jgi:cobaltochelatase CobS
MRPEYTPEVLPEVIPAVSEIIKEVKGERVEPVEKYIVDNVLKKEKEEEKPLVSLTNLGKEIGKVLKDAVEQATKIALENGNKTIQVVLGDNKEVKEISGHTHEKMPTLLRILSARLPLFLVGEAGSGKTYLVEQCAEALGLKYYCISVCAQTTASALLGYMDANGHYVRSLFREAYENGGVFLLDEVDNGNPNVLSVLNASISNHCCAFPDQMIKKHPDFILCASGNTYGHGANRKYVGRLEIDGATLDRFVFVEIGYDNKLEEKICGNKAYAKLIQALRKKANDLKLRHIISPRASINGVKLLQKGMDIKEVLQCTVFRDMSPDVFAQLTESKEYKEALKEVSSGDGEDKEKKKGRRKKSDASGDGKDGDDVSDEEMKKMAEKAEKFYKMFDGKSPWTYGDEDVKELPELKGEGEITEGAF